MTGTYTIVRQALVTRQHVVGEYQDRIREMCPHVIGTKQGREKALFYQFGGTSKSGLGPIGSADNWRCIFLDQLRILEVRNGTWYTVSVGSWTQFGQDCVDWVDVQATL